MAKNILVLSCDFRETRAALIEDGIIAELHIERKGRQSSTVGNVYLGKVTRVLPGLQAAFIDIGQERAAFLHVEDLIRPDDFDEYLAGGRKLARGKEEGGAEVEVDEADADADADADGAEAAGGSEAPAAGGAEAEAADDARERRLDAERDRALDGEAAPVSDARESKRDLETTVSYPNWPHPPSGRQREGAPSPRPARNGVTHIDRALGDDEGEGAPSSGRLPTPPPAAGSSVAAFAEASSPSMRELVPAAENSAEELLVRGGHGDSEPPPVPESDHSFHSAPTLDELPEDGDDDGEGEGEDEDEGGEGARAAESRASLDEGEGEGEASSDDDDLSDMGDLPGFTVSDPGEPVPRAPAPAREGDRGGRGRRRRGRGRGGERGERGGEARGRGGESRGAEGRGRGGESRGGGRDRRGGRPSGQGMPGRISKTTPIREVVKEGQEIIVQVTKDPIGTKGARCSSHISLPGRYVVYLPTVDHIGISKRIGSDKERARLREAIEAMKPPSGGLIVRTVAEGLTKKGLKQDVGYLVRLWGEIAKKREGARAPTVLSSELDLVLKVARDLFTDEVDEVVIDDKEQYTRLCRFVEMFAPDRVKDVKFYDEEEPIFDEYGIEDEIGRALSRKVPLPSGGYLIIDQAEALTAIDVNTGRFVGKGSKDMEETILKTNLEAVHEIAYQLRFRNIGGLIILDLIDMEQHKNREKVRRTLEELLQKDKAKTTLNRISELGLIEMTRKRTRESLGRLMHEPCFYCDGTGQLQSKETVAYEILRELRRKRSTLPGYSVIINAHPAVADVLTSTEKAAVQDAENKYMRKIIVTPRKEYHLEQFDLQGK